MVNDFMKLKFINFYFLKFRYFSGHFNIEFDYNY